MAGNILTCVYCGTAYPEGTAPHGEKVLTDHIKICPTHPLRQAEATIAKLRSALAALIGASTIDELEQMEAGIRITPAPEADKIAALNAVPALIETAE